MMITKKSSQIQFEIKNDLPVLARQRNMFSSKSVKIFSLNERIDKIKNLLQNYESLKKIPFNYDASQSSKLNLMNGVL